MWPLLLLALAVTCSFAMQVVFTPLQELAKLDLSLSDLQISLVQGVATSVPVALLAIPMGRLVDRVNRCRLLIAMALIWSLGVVATGLADSFALLFIARMIAGVGTTFALPVAISLAADFCSPAARGRALLLLSTGRIIGSAMAFAIGGSLVGILATQWTGTADPFGLAPWRAVHLLFGIASVLLIVPLLFLREPARLETSEVQGLPLAPALQAIWARRRLLIPLFIGQISAAMATIAAAVWASPVLIRDHGLTPAEFAGWLGASILLSGLVGSVFGGLSADWALKGRIRGGLLIGAVIAAIVAIPGAFFPLMPDATSVILLMTLLLTSGAVTGLVTATAIAVLIPNDLRGVCMGVFFVAAALLGTGLAPTLVTLASAAFGGETHLRYGLTLVALVTSVISAVAYGIAARAVTKTP